MQGKTSFFFLLVLAIVYSQCDVNFLTGRSGQVDTAAMAALTQMQAAARTAGFTLRIVSGLRNFNTQKTIWERKWHDRTRQALPSDTARVQNILRYSAMPSTSRHHWGTDFDLNSVEPADWSHSPLSDVYNWLVSNAGTFGFCQPYTAGRTVGYQEEKWHWSYKPKSCQHLNNYRQCVHYSDITDFSGSSEAQNVRVIEDYVFGIDSSCTCPDSSPPPPPSDPGQSESQPPPGNTPTTGGNSFILTKFTEQQKKTKSFRLGLHSKLQSKRNHKKRTSTYGDCNLDGYLCQTECPATGFVLNTDLTCADASQKCCAPVAPSSDPTAATPSPDGGDGQEPAQLIVHPDDLDKDSGSD